MSRWFSERLHTEADTGVVPPGNAATVVVLLSSERSFLADANNAPAPAGHEVARVAGLESHGNDVRADASSHPVVESLNGLTFIHLRPGDTLRLAGLAGPIRTVGAVFRLPNGGTASAMSRGPITLDATR